MRNLRRTPDVKVLMLSRGFIFMSSALQSPPKTITITFSEYHEYSY